AVGTLNHRGRRPERLWATDSDVHAQLCPTNQERVSGIEAAVTDVAESDLTGRLVGVLQHRHRIRQELGRMDLIGQPVVDWHVGKLDQRVYDFLTGAAEFYGVVE